MKKDEKIFVTNFDFKKANRKANQKPKERSSDENIHAGHRTRLLELVNNVGVDNLSDVQFVELFLTYIFPRGDVNPLAHRLLDKFENFTKIVCAPVEQLKLVRGINDRSAQMISNFKDLFYYYATANMGRKVYISNYSLLIDIVEDHLRFQTEENLLLIAISPANFITHKRMINLDSSGKVAVSIQDVAQFLSMSKPASLVVAHCHPFGKSIPSNTDVEAHHMIKEFCETCGVNLIDSYIVGNDGVFSLEKDKLVRIYCDMEDLEEIFTNK